MITLNRHSKEDLASFPDDVSTFLNQQGQNAYEFFGVGVDELSQDSRATIDFLHMLQRARASCQEEGHTILIRITTTQGFGWILEKTDVPRRVVFAYPSTSVEMDKCGHVYALQLIQQRPDLVQTNRPFDGRSELSVALHLLTQKQEPGGPHTSGAVQIRDNERLQAFLTHTPEGREYAKVEST